MKYKVFEHLSFSDEEMTDRLAQHVMKDEKKMQRILERSERIYDSMKENTSDAYVSETYTVAEKKTRHMMSPVISLAACAVLAIGIGSIYFIRNMPHEITPGTTTEHSAIYTDSARNVVMTRFIEADVAYTSASFAQLWEDSDLVAVAYVDETDGILSAQSGLLKTIVKLSDVKVYKGEYNGSSFVLEGGYMNLGKYAEAIPDLNYSVYSTEEMENGAVCTRINGTHIPTGQEKLLIFAQYAQEDDFYWAFSGEKSVLVFDGDYVTMEGLISGNNWTDPFAEDFADICQGTTEKTEEGYVSITCDWSVLENVLNSYQTDRSYSAELGIKLCMEDVSPTGAALVIQKTEGTPTGEVEFGSYYFLEHLVNGVWEGIPYITDEEVGWDSEAYMLTDDETRWDVNWEWLYGRLAPGNYRIGKKFMDFRGSSDFDEYLLYAEFTVLAETPENPAPDMDTKEGIYNAMLNSIDYFDKASGKIIYSHGNLPDCLVVEFETELDTAKAYSRTTQLDIDNPEEVLEGKPANFGCVIRTDITLWSDGETLYEIDPVNKNYRREASVITRKETALPEDTPRRWIDENGIPCWQYRNDPTNASDASMCLQPQGITFSYLTDFDAWEITGEETFQGRECIIITGRTENLNVRDFTFYVDKQNGTLLQYRGYDSNGKLCDFLYAENIAFDNDAAEVRTIDLADYRALSEFDASSEHEITEQDDAAILWLCSKACHKWARLYNHLDESDFSELVTTDALNQYLIQSAENCSIISISASESADYEISQIDYNGRFATVKGIYCDTNESDGMFIFIIENIEGRLCINDMIYDTKDTFDNQFRNAFVQNPQPDFWSDPEQYADVLERSSVTR